MKRHTRFLTVLLGIVFLSLLLTTNGSGAAPEHSAAAKDDTASAESLRPIESESEPTIYKWNVGEKGLPLLGLSTLHLKSGFDQTLTYPADQFEVSIFKSLNFDEDHDRYLMPAVSRVDRKLIFVEFNRAGATNTYTSAGGLELIDKGNMKQIRTIDGTRLLFLEYPDGELRCAMIKGNTGEVLNLLYTANGLLLHGVIDSSGRSLTFNYGQEGIRSLTQTWMSNLEGFTKTWVIGDEVVNEAAKEFAHSGASRSGKRLPPNAVIREYTAQMIASDRLLAQMFGGPQAVACGNGFEPAGLAATYPLYRGDTVGDDGSLRAGHLSHAIHLYGSPDGRGESPLYVPAGFTSHSSEPSPTDAAMTFYYPRLGDLTDVTLVVFHIADFRMESEGDRVRIGSIGGRGGGSPFYRHSHIEFYRGNSGLPPAAARASLRLDPASVLGMR